MWRSRRHVVTGMPLTQAQWGTQGPSKSSAAMGRSASTRPTLQFSAAAERGTSAAEWEQSKDSEGRLEKLWAPAGEPVFSPGQEYPPCPSPCCPRPAQASCQSAPVLRKKRYPLLKQGMNIHWHEPLQTHLGEKLDQEK